MIGVVIRIILIVLFVALGVFLLRRAAVQRRVWKRREAGLDQAEAWWGRAHRAPFDQDREGVPAEIEPFLGPAGPRVEMRSPRPAQAESVWGWLLLALACLLAITVAAQMMSGSV